MPSRTDVLALAAAAAGLGLPAAAPGASAAITGPIVVPGATVVALAAGVDGSLGVATTSRTAALEKKATTVGYRRIDAAGVLGPVFAASGPGAIEASIALTPGGGAVGVYDIPGADPGRTSVVAARTLGADGAVLADAPISTPGQPASNPGPIVVGPTGTAAVTFSQGPADRPAPRLAFRAARAGAFSPSMPLDRGGRSSVYSVVLGPDGGGMVIAATNDEFEPEPMRVRRLSAAGALGPWLKVPVGKLGEVTVDGVFSGSTFVLAVGTVDLGDTIRGRLFTTALPRVGRRFTRPQKLLTVSNKLLGDAGLDLVALPRGRVALLTEAKGRGLQLFEGRPSALRKARPLVVGEPYAGRLLPAATGNALDAFWLGPVTRATDRRILTTTRAAPGRRFPKPYLVPGFPADPNAASFGGSSLSLSGPARLPDGRAAIAYNPSDAEGKQTDGVILTTD